MADRAREQALVADQDVQLRCAASSSSVYAQSPPLSFTPVITQGNAALRRPISAIGKRSVVSDGMWYRMNPRGARIDSIVRENHS